MALNSAKLVSRSLGTLKTSLPYLCVTNKISIRNQSKVGNVAPYRPWPFDDYFWPGSAKFWLPEYPVKDNEQEVYQDEEIYLDELESRMRLYDKKYAMPDKMKSLHNEFGYENVDDRAFAVYGPSLDHEDDVKRFGRGKKINPANYCNPGFETFKRNPIPPVQLMSREDTRRSRGSMANFRELPPEQPSIFKFWNAGATLCVVSVVLVGKEWIVAWGHDVFDVLGMGCFFGQIASFMADWFAWWGALQVQEAYDREWMILKKNRDEIHKILNNLTNKPSEKSLLSRLARYREILSEKVLQKTLSNKLARITDSTVRRLKDKLNEELTTRKNVESSFKKNALEETLEYFEESNVRDNFTMNAINEFTSGETAKIVTGKSNVQIQTSLFQEKYNECFDNVRNEYINEQTSSGTLPWVFRDESERNSQRMSANDKESEYENRIREWESQRNSVNAPMPAFG